jgi:hypothetical protein
MISIKDVINNTTTIQELHMLFFVAVNKFLKLLHHQDNIYKNKDFYINTINNYIKEDKLSIKKTAIFIIMIIYNENLCNFQKINNKLRYIEKIIISELIMILSNKYITDHIIKTINNVLLVNFEKYYDIYNTNYGCELSINYNSIIEINSINIKNIYENFHKIKRLIVIAELEKSLNIEEINEIDDYLFCLFYYDD